MRLYPQSAEVQLEFDKVKALLAKHTKTVTGHQRAAEIRIHTHIDFVKNSLQQTHEFRLIAGSGQAFPLDFTHHPANEIKLLSIPGATLGGEQLMLLVRLLANTEQLFRWFDYDRQTAFPALHAVVKNSYYEKVIRQMIEDVLDETGLVKDNASEELGRIRNSLYRKRAELRRVFDRLIQKMNRLGHLSDIGESFINGRRVLAVNAESKRMVKGVMHGESDTRQTTYIEPEETTALNNEVFSLENEEGREVQRILRALTARLQPYHALLSEYVYIIGEFDFIRARARLAMDMQAEMPNVENKAIIELKKAYHPLLFLYNQEAKKPTIPLDLSLDSDHRILVISGPNAGGKTVTMKTIGLCQMMVQAGLMVPVHPTSTFGIFKQLFIHIGDTQSIEFELSTYSSHLQHMKYFLEMANGKTLFFIDELGSGSDPNLGGAFAEVIMEELAHKRAFGVVTTHYLNLKVMANRVKGILNGAMQFDEENLAPRYKLITGKPGSSYTFAIAERIGLPKKFIDRARKLVDDNQFQLDKLLNRTEQDLQRMEEKEKSLQKLLQENERLRHKLEKELDKEKHRQQVELLKEQNKLKQEQLDYLRDMDRKLRVIIAEWRKAENKEDAIKQIHALLFKQKESSKQVTKKEKQLNSQYRELKDAAAEGDLVKLRKNRQVGTLKELRGKKAIVQIGLIPLTVDVSDLVKVETVSDN